MSPAAPGVPRRSRWRELPPTAGLPLLWRDLLPGGGADGLEAALADFLGVEEVLLTCSGTAALMVALRCLMARSSRRRVAVPGFTCPLVAIAIHALGLEVCPCDTLPGTAELDPDSLAPLCDDRLLAMLPTHLAGRVAVLDTVLALAEGCGAWVIEDAAQALGARAGGVPVGLRGHIGFYSLAAGKGLTLYEGGVLVSRDPALRQGLRDAADAMLRPGRWMEARRSLELLGYGLLYNPLGLTLAYGRGLRRALRAGDAETALGDRFPLEVPLHRVGSWRQAVGRRALTRLPGFLEATRKQGQGFAARLAAVPGLRVLRDRPGEQGTWPVLVLVFDRARDAEAVLSRLWGEGLGVSRLFARALPDYAYLRGIVPDHSCPQARDFGARSLSIGNSLFLRPEEQDRILLVLRDVLQPGLA
ncbi:DegT/DnrJ/EryC1/StrS family aminotransferase [Roseomonas gilardii]|uniref:DegT/DnrJ/EryC1/StrS family aminotransferase n=1 Tax=Roseomonas gilardii TaxID=257708 RepID=UPI000AF916B1|nr:DegT/DnrJ/EryC1/StrS family aminotransferase [Roseomonas gilardii]